MKRVNNLIEDTIMTTAETLIKLSLEDSTEMVDTYYLPRDKFRGSVSRYTFCDFTDNISRVGRREDFTFSDGSFISYANGYISWYTTAPQTTPYFLTKEQETETRRLLDIIDEKIVLGERGYILNQWIQPCGSKGCVIGDYVLQKHDSEHLSVDGLKVIASSVADDFERVFGFCSTTCIDGRRVSICGDSTEGSLEERASYIREVLSNTVIVD